jgi:glutamyl/glutaminyl-tRNA synthetase
VFRDLRRPEYIRESKKVYMLGDNQGALALTKNLHLYERSKHIDIYYYYVRDLVERGKAFVEYILTDEMIANGITKPL